MWEAIATSFVIENECAEGRISVSRRAAQRKEEMGNASISTFHSCEDRSVYEIFETLGITLT